MNLITGQVKGMIDWWSKELVWGLIEARGIDEEFSTHASVCAGWGLLVAKRGKLDAMEWKMFSLMRSNYFDAAQDVWKILALVLGLGGVAEGLYQSVWSSKCNHNNKAAHKLEECWGRIQNPLASGDFRWMLSQSTKGQVGNSKWLYLFCLEE